MALTAIDICNDAISLLGHTATIVSLDAPTLNEERICARFYARVRDECLRSYQWKFAKKRVKLLESASPYYNKVTNGSMEADANWTGITAPDTNERSAAKAYAGTYSRHVADNDAGSDGIYQNVSLLADSIYNLRCKLDVVSGSVIVEVVDSVQGVLTTQTLTETGKWLKVAPAQFTAPAALGTTSVRVKNGVATATAFECYVDNVVLVEDNWGYTFAYDLPTDWLRTIKCDLDDVEATWKQEGKLIVTDEDMVRLLYIYQVTDPAIFDTLFVSAFTARLAATLAIPLGPAARAGEMWDLYSAKLTEATYIDGVEDTTDAITSNALINVRY
jgi:hypothetical protein